MPTTLIDTQIKKFTPAQFAQYINDEVTPDFDDYAAAVLALGLSAAGAYISGGASLALAAQLIAAGSITLGLTAVADLVQDGETASARNTVLEKMVTDGGKAKVTTKLYQWSSGGGNSYTWYTETTYAWVVA